MERQRSFAQAEYAQKKKKTRRERFLNEMEAVVPWAKLVACIEPFYFKGERGRKSGPTWVILAFSQPASAQTKGSKPNNEMVFDLDFMAVGEGSAGRPYMAVCPENASS
jgi:hypothetical protein